ncbi:MAG: helix-turn-helix domain-containing protein [Bullifex sp.]
MCRLKKFHYEVRISKSLDLLKEPDITIAAAAVASGFEDQAYYTRTFRKVKGMTPSEWRKNHIK